MRKILILLFLTAYFVSNAQIRYGIIGGVNFPGVRTDYSNIRSLPVDQSGMNLLLGFLASNDLSEKITVQTGISAYKSGFTYGKYDDFYGIEFDEYNVCNVISVPLNFYYNFIPEDDYGMPDLNFIASLGAGIYGSYILNGSVTDEDGNVTKATFNNLNRMNYGVDIVAKVGFFKHFDVFVSYQFGLSNLIKTGSGKINQDGLIMGVSYLF